VSAASPSEVEIVWKWIDWEPSYKWADEISAQLTELGLTEKALNRCVYVIRAAGSFAIRYPTGISPTLYIGEGNFKNRINQHKKWLEPLIELVGEFKFTIGVCIPRLRNSLYAYQDFEAYLLLEFKTEYGCAPLKNAQMERRRNNYVYYPADEIRKGIMIGKGSRFKWSLEPMKSSAYHDIYWKTH
jgi:hypothetical protein